VADEFDDSTGGVVVSKDGTVVRISLADAVRVDRARAGGEPSGGPAPAVV
jgi:hypothetical protein